MRLGTQRAMMVATGLPGLFYVAMALNGEPRLAVTLFVVQWGTMHVAGPLFSGLYNAHLPDPARATGLSLINAIVTVYIGVGGVLLGWLAEWSLPGTFALLGTIILIGSVAIQVDERGVGSA
jgi:predicted MFS family arabinose efflux permease